MQAYLICWNEARLLPFVIKHYQQLCNKITILDNFSNDGSQEIARSMGCAVKTFGRPGLLDDRTYMEVKNECWKKTHNGADRRDWVIVADCDEVLWINKPPSFEASIIITQGFNVFSHDFPRETLLEITTGVLDENYSKSVIFDPKRITDINYRIGAHVCSPRGDVSWSEQKLWLLHYRNIGGPQALVERHKLYRDRMSEENKLRNFGIHYTYSDEQRIKEWEEKYSASKPLISFL